MSRNLPLAKKNWLYVVTIGCSTTSSFFPPFSLLRSLELDSLVGLLTLIRPSVVAYSHFSALLVLQFITVLCILNSHALQQQ